MRSVFVRWITLISVVVVALLIATQLFWLKRIYRLEENQFNSNVFKSIKGLYGDLDILVDPTVPLQKFVEKPSRNSYLAKVDCLPPKDSILFFLGMELQDFELLTDCNLAMYSADSNKYIYQQYLPAAASANPAYSGKALEVFERDYHYILLQFPHRTRYIIREMGFWIASSVLVLLVLAGFALSLLFLYRQKFLNEIQNDFVNNFTHEFKTPLAVLKIAADVLQQPDIAQKPARLHQYSGIIKEQTEHLHNQVHRLLDFAGSRQRKLPLQKEPLQLNTIISEAVAQLEPLIKDRAAEVQCRLHPQPITLFADKRNLELVLVNLVENAVKYSPEKPVVTITSFEKGRYAGIAVKDQGIGIARQYHKHLFKKFYRVPTGNIHNVKGFGLGLNFVKKVVDGHRGRIEVKSKPGQGSEFIIWLPK